MLPRRALPVGRRAPASLSSHLLDTTLVDCGPWTISLLWKNSPMRSSAVRQSFLDYFAGHGHQIVRSAPLVPADDPDAAVHQRGDEPVQGCVPWSRTTVLRPGHHRPEVHAGQREAQRPRQRRSLLASPYVLRDAGQLLVRRLLQAGCDPIRLDVADGEYGSCHRNGSTRRSSTARPGFRGTTRRMRSGARSFRPTASSSSD